MRTFDLNPLYRSTVGFDRLFNLLDTVNRPDAAPSYPPYNIERMDENAYRVTLAVAGFAQDDLDIEVRDNTLTVSGKQDKETSDKAGQLLHQGIAARSFERRFELADHVVVKGAKLENGLLSIDLVREVPEELKPRRIAINTSGPSHKVIDNKAA